MATDIGPKIGIQGEAEFRKELANINTGIKTLGSEMKLVTSEFIDNEKSVEALTAKNDVMERTVSSLNERLELQTKMLKESADKYGEADEKTQKWQQAVNATQAEINKYNAEIEKNNGEIEALGNETDNTSEAVEDLGKESVTAGDLLKANLASEAIVAGVKALASAVAEGAKALGDMVVNAAYAADDLNTMAKTTGLSTEELQKFQYASDLIDVSVDTLTGSMTKLTSNMANAAKGSGDAYAAFEELGVAVVDGNGELRDRNEVFNETIKALGNIENETERDAVAMKVFGKSAKDLNPLILGGADALEELGQQAEDAGLILGQDSLDELNKVSDAMDTFKATTSMAGNLFMVGFADPLASGINTITGYLQQMTSAFSEGGWSALADSFGAVMDDLTAKILEYLPQVMEFGIQIINNIVLGVTDMLPDIVAAATEIMVTLINGIAELLPELIPKAVDAVITIANALIDNVDMLIDSAIAIILALTDGLTNNIPKLLGAVPTIIGKLVSALIEKAPELLAAAGEIIGQLLLGIANSYAQLMQGAYDMITTIVGALGEKISEFLSVGADIVSGIWQGISDGFNWIKEKIKGWVGNVLDFVKGLFGIGSPSKVFAEYGKFIDQGLGNGIDDNADYVTDAMSDLAAATTDAFTPDIAGAVNSAASGMVAHIPAPEMSMADVVAGAVNGMQGALAGAGGSYTINLVLPDGTQLARYALPSLIAVANSNGTPILNPA